MPWIVKKHKDKYCVFPEGSDSPVEGACHNTRADAIRQMRALYANSKEFSQAIAGTLSMLQPMKFSEKDLDDGKLRKWVQALPYGSWDHPMYGMSYFARHNADTMVRNFNEGVHGTQKLTTDFEHGLDPAKGTKASGVILDMEARDDGLWWFIEFTPQASQEIIAGEWNYFSPEYHDAWENPMNQAIYADVARGGALTNKPWIKGMMPLNFSAVLVEKGVLTQNDVTGEVAWEEHHDPEQDPHQQPKPEDPIDDGSGSRINTPPPEGGNEGEQEASVEVTAGMLAALGLPEDATAEQVEEAVTNMATEIAPLREARDAMEAEKAFSEKFPEQAKALTEAQAELNRLKKKDAERDAEAFGKQFSEFTIKVPNPDAGDDEPAEVEVRKGFSALVCDSLTELHKKFSEGTATAADLTPILEKIVSGNGIVEYGERGTSQDHTGEEDAADPQEAAKRLSELAYAKIAEAGGESKLSFGDALAQVTADNPELARLYNKRSGKEG